MERSLSRSPLLPPRLSSRRAKFFIGVSVGVLVLAVTGGFRYDGWHQIAHVTAYATMGLANLSWAIGSLLLEGPLSRAMRIAFAPLIYVSLFAFGASFAFRVGCGS